MGVLLSFNGQMMTSLIFRLFGFLSFLNGFIIKYIFFIIDSIKWPNTMNLERKESY